MQSKALLTRLKKLERKAMGGRKIFVFFGQPRKAELDRLPPGAKVIVFVGEDKIPK